MIPTPPQLAVMVLLFFSSPAVTSIHSFEIFVNGLNSRLSLSRGCSPVISVEADRDHASFIRECMKKISADRDNILIRGDVFRFIRTCKQQFDLIFADPPYALPELPTIPNLILEKKMLKPGGLLVFEHGKKNDFSSIPGFIEHRAYGSVNFSLFRTPEEE